jgi:hypothetical protein
LARSCAIGTRRPRPPSTDVAQEAGLIRYVRGAITVLDWAGLEAAACERYGIIRAQYVRALG